MGLQAPAQHERLQTDDDAMRLFRHLQSFADTISGGSTKELQALGKLEGLDLN